MWVDIERVQPRINTVILVTDGHYVGLAERVEDRLNDGRVLLYWRVPGISGYEWELDEPSHWQEIDLPSPPEARL
jgi:hypothetical protein